MNCLFKSFCIIFTILSLFYIGCSNSTIEVIEKEEIYSKNKSPNNSQSKIVRRPIINLRDCGTQFWNTNKYYASIDSTGSISKIKLSIIEEYADTKKIKQSYSWSNGHLSVVINDEITKQYIANEHGEININVLDVLPQLKKKTINLNLKLSLSSKIDNYEDKKILIVPKDVLLYLICMDEESVDMTEGKPFLAPYTTADICLLSHQDFKMNSGEGDVFLIEVHNKGKDSNYQLKLRTKSDYEPLNDIELLIGKLDPNEIKNRCLAFNIMKTQQTSDIQVDFLFSELNGYTPQNKKVILHVTGKKPPVFQYGYSIADDGSGNSVGNGNGIIELRESIDIHFSVKNIGEADAEKTTVKIQKLNPDEEGLIINIDEIDLGNIRSNQIADNLFTITIQNTFKKKWIELVLVIDDSVFHSTLTGMITLPLNKHLNINNVPK